MSVINVLSKLENFCYKNEKRTLICAFVSGLMALFVSPPFFSYLLLLIQFSFLADILYKASNLKSRILRLISFSFGYHLAIFHWMLWALTVDVSFYWMIPFAAIFICGLATAMLLFAAIFYLILSKRLNSPWFHYFGISLFWTFFEIIKGYFPFGGLPWQGIGMIFAANDYIIQIAYYIGILGCNILSILLALLPFTFARAKFGVIASFSGLICCIYLIILGYYRINIKQKINESKEVSILGIQANVPAEILLNPSLEDEGLLNYIQQSQVATETKKETILIWPESAFGLYTNINVENKNLFINLMSSLPLNVKYLIFGSLYIDENTGQYFNRISAIDRKGNIMAHYDKQKLVPFGEYIPPRNLFPFLTKKLTKGMVDLTKGSGYNLIEVGGIVFAPIICFESVFASQVMDKQKVKKADAILQISNDVWFGNSNGAYQHLAFSKFLAVIYKTPLIRIANSGISGVYDEYGRTTQITSLNTSGFINITNLFKKNSAL